MSSPTLERLGYPPEARVVIFHADDLGMCRAANAAFSDILAIGTVSCGSIMVPCPWFRDAAALAGEHPRADLGVHLTLTSEWGPYRWGPVSTRDPASGLLDEEGYLWRDVASLHAHMDPEAAGAEMRAQVEKALAAGIDVTHLDTHMGSIAHPDLLPCYLDLAREYRLPVMLPRLSPEALVARGLPEDQARHLAGTVAALESSGEVLLVDHLAGLEHSGPGDYGDHYRRLIEALPPGLTHLIYHPSQPTPEATAIMGPARAAVRAGDWETFSDPGLRAVLDEAGVVSIGYRTLREALRR